MRLLIYLIYFYSLISEKRRLISAVRLSDWFNRPLLLELDDSFNNLLRGLAHQQQGFSDQFLDSEITQFLFKYDLGTVPYFARFYGYPQYNKRT